MILIIEFSLAWRQNLRNALQIAKCEALICTLYFLSVTKKDDKKDNLKCILYI